MMTRFEEYLANLQRFGIRPGLERVHALLERFEQPHQAYPHILVGGTNGKGSTCEFLARLLALRSERIGLFTSPHLYRWNERIRIVQSSKTKNQSPFPDAISDDDLDALFDAAKPHLDAVANSLGQPTEFETLTALAIWHFQRARVDAAVLEVGLGGRWDATNTTDPLVSVITHVALDHTDRLGNTVEQIARDKVEIARAGRVLVTAETKANVLDVFAAHCEKHQVKFWPIQAPAAANDNDGLAACLNYIESASKAQQDGFQRTNYRTALAAQFAFLTAQNRQPTAANLQLSVPGRLEIVRENPRVILDVCNNPDGAAHLARALPKLVGRKAKLILVLGILADKDFDSMIAYLAPLAHFVIATQSQSPRATDAAHIAWSAKTHCKKVETIVPVNSAVQRAFELAAPQDCICIAGSFTTVGEVERKAILSA